LIIDEDHTIKFNPNMTFTVEDGGKMFFKVNGKICKVLGDSKWEMIKRWFGQMKDE
jgi:hypothetical protein